MSQDLSKPISSGGRRKLEALISLAGAQLLVAFASFLRLPFVIAALGVDGFGLYVLVGNIAPFLMVATAGARMSTRALVAERSGFAPSEEVEQGFLLSKAVARRGAVGLLSVGVPCSLVAGFVFRGSGVTSGAGLTFVLLVTVILCSSSSPGGAAWGKFEAEGRQSFVHSLMGIVAVLGLAVTVLAAQVAPNFVILATINVATTTAPFLLAGFVARSKAQADEIHSVDEFAKVRRSMLHATGRAIPPLGARALDPFLVSPALGFGATAIYGLGQRMSLFNTLAIQATAPVLARDAAVERGSGRAIAWRRVAKQVFVQVVVSSSVGASLVVVGPALGRALSGGDLVVPRSLLVAFAVAGAAFSASEACASIASGPRGLDLGWRIDGVGLVINLVVSVALLSPLGMSGPVWGSAVAATFTLGFWVVALGRTPALFEETHGATGLDAQP